MYIFFVSGKLCSVLADPENGSKVCSNGRNLGSACEFECDENFSSFGPLLVTCIEEDGKPIWDNLPPTCIRK